MNVYDGIFHAKIMTLYVDKSFYVKLPVVIANCYVWYSFYVLLYLSMFEGYCLSLESYACVGK